MPWTSEHTKWLVDTGERLKIADGKEVEVWEFRHENDEAVLSATSGAEPAYTRTMLHAGVHPNIDGEEIQNCAVTYGSFCLLTFALNG